MKKLLLTFAMIFTMYSAQSEVIYNELGRVSNLDTLTKVLDYNVPYKSCDSSVILVEVTDTLTIESAVLEVMSVNGYKATSDTLLSATTISGGIRAIALSSFPYQSIHTRYRVVIKLKGKTAKKASAIFTMIYIKEN